MSDVYYLAGPMTGRPGFNYPLFDSVAKKLRDEGYDIRSPAEMDEPHVREVASASENGSAEDFLAVLKAKGHENETWGDFLSRDVKLIADSDINGIILLPEWWTSKGARLEAFVSLSCGYTAYEYHEGVEAGPYKDVIPCTNRYIMKQITKGMSRGR